MASIRVDGSTVAIDGIRLDDRVLAELLTSQDSDQWEGILRRVLEVGARGLLTMGLGIDLAEVDRRVRRSVEDVTAEARAQVEQVLAAARRAFTADFDPELRSSLVARTLAEFGAWRDGFVRNFNPEYSDSHTARFLNEVKAFLGPDGVLESRLHDALDPEADGSALAKLSELIDVRLQEMRDLLMTERGRLEEADHGTRKGFEFEDAVEEALREATRGAGWIIERTTNVKGNLSAEALVGDFVATLPNGRKITLEAKNTGRINLTGKEGILAELDRAMANRAADAAICVSARDAFPREVGPFAVYGDRVLVVDEGDGTMLAIALRWTALMLEQAARSGRSAVDHGFVEERLQRLRQLAQTFSSNRRSLTDIKTSVEGVQSSLEQLRAELLFLVDEISQELQRSEPTQAPAPVLPLRSEVG